MLIGWRSDKKEDAPEAAADSWDIPFIFLVHLDIPENRSAIGAIVSGAVAKHPGDPGHRAIAEVLFDKIVVEE